MSARDEILIANAPYRTFAGCEEATSPGWPARNRVTTPLCLPGLLTPSECAEVVRLSRPHAASMNSLSYPTEGQRVAESRWILPEPGWAWVFDRVEQLFLVANAHYGFDTRGLVDPLLVATYPEGGGFDWHVDTMSGMTATRKLSLSVQLSHRDDYEGGELEFAGQGEMPLSRGQGTVICFPSFACHRVRPVVRGLREALIAWAHGPTFR